MINKIILLLFILGLTIFLNPIYIAFGESSNLWKHIPWDEVERNYGAFIANNIKQMSEHMPPTQIRELDRWTGNIHFEYILPNNQPTGNINIWRYDYLNNQIFWSGENWSQSYSHREAIIKINNYNNYNNYNNLFRSLNFNNFN